MRYVLGFLVDVIGEECLRIKLHGPLRTLFCTEEMYRHYSHKRNVKALQK